MMPLMHDDQEMASYSSKTRGSSSSRSSFPNIYIKQTTPAIVMSRVPFDMFVCRYYMTIGTRSWNGANNVLKLARGNVYCGRIVPAADYEIWGAS